MNKTKLFSDSNLTDLQSFMFDTMASADMAVDWFCDRHEVNATDDVVDFVVDAHFAFFGEWTLTLKSWKSGIAKPLMISPSSVNSTIKCLGRIVMFPTLQIPPVQHSFRLTDSNTNRAAAWPVDQLSTIRPKPLKSIL